MKHDELPLDPEVRRAVLNLFHANDGFRQAYQDWMKASGPDARARLRRVGEAEREVDQARMEAVAAQRRAFEDGDGPP